MNTKKLLSGILTVSFVIFSSESYASMLRQQQVQTGMMHISTLSHIALQRQPSSSRHRKNKHRKTSRFQNEHRSMQRSFDRRSHAQNHEDVARNDSYEQKSVIEEKIYEDDPEINNCIVTLTHLYASKKSFSQKTRKQIPVLMQQLKQWLLEIKNNPSLLTHQSLESIIKQVLPSSISRKEKRGEDMSQSLDNAVKKKVDSYCDKYLHGYEAIHSKLVGFIVNTINEMIQLFAVKPQKNSSREKSGKKDRWIFDEMKEALEEPDNFYTVDQESDDEKEMKLAYQRYEEELNNHEQALEAFYKVEDDYDKNAAELNKENRRRIEALDEVESGACEESHQVKEISEEAKAEFKQLLREIDEEWENFKDYQQMQREESDKIVKEYEQELAKENRLIIVAYHAMQNSDLSDSRDSEPAAHEIAKSRNRKSKIFQK